MAKFGTGKLYTSGQLYGIDPQYLLGPGNIASTADLGLPAVNPGPVTLQGVGNIAAAEAWGTPWIFRMPQKLALGLTISRLAYGVHIRRLSTAPQIRRLQVISNG